MTRLFKALPMALAITFTAMAAQAHHSFAMFDRTTEIVKTGTVQRWAFNNPHSWLYLNVKNDDGTQALWSFESSSPTQLIPHGITGTTFEPGSTVTVMFCPLRDGRPGGGLGWVRLEGGKYLSTADGGCNGSEENISRWKGWMTQGYKSNKEAQASGAK
ncbi:MAG: DUF6152 family protein [Pseudomonadota bacterium]